MVSESDGRMQMLTPMDPLLLAIPYLRKSERPVPLDDLIEDQDFSHINDLVPLLTRDKMNKIATSKGSEDLNVWVWNEEKCLEYLVSKVDKLKEHIKEKGMTTLDNTSSTNYISAKRKDETEEEEDCKRFAWEFLSDFLQDDISAKLGKAIKLKENAVLKPQQPAKKAKLDNASQGPKDDFYDKNGSSNNAKSQESQNAKQKALAKSAKGTKNIASFFARK